MRCHTAQLPVPSSQTQYSLITELPATASFDAPGFPELMHCKFQLNNELGGWDQRHGCGAWLTEECQARWKGSGTNEPKLANRAGPRSARCANYWTTCTQKQININQCSHREGIICNITVKRVNNMNNAASENVGMICYGSKKPKRLW